MTTWYSFPSVGFTIKMSVIMTVRLVTDDLLDHIITVLLLVIYVLYGLHVDPFFHYFC